MNYLRLVSTVVVLSGCAGPLASVRVKAAVDLKCTDDKVDVAALANGGYKAEGCGEVGRYFVHCNIFGLCGTVTGQSLTALVKKQASFDLQCPPDELKIAELNTDTYGATGCAKRASYVLIPDRGSFKIVQNTQAQ